MGLDVGVVDIEYLERPRAAVYAFLRHLAENADSADWRGGTGEETFVQYMRGTLLDSTAKKTAFLSHVCDALELQGMSVRTGRAETLARETELREKFDIAFARAVAEVAALAELTLPFARVGGIVVMHKKADIADELERAQNAIETLGGRLREVLPISLPQLDDRALVVLEKTRPTPERYPRRPGMPAKRPLA